MSEVESVPINANFIQCLIDINEHCISPDAVIEPGAFICLAVAPNGRYTEIGEAHIETGAKIETLVHISDGVSVEKGAEVQFSANIGKYTRLGHSAVIGVGVTIGENVEVLPNSTIGNFSRIESGSVVSWGTELKSQTYVVSCIFVSGKTGPHTIIKPV